eukprot:4298636-Prorocentrum_lima.AAC.1
MEAERKKTERLLVPTARAVEQASSMVEMTPDMEHALVNSGRRVALFHPNDEKHAKDGVPSQDRLSCTLP